MATCLQRWALAQYAGAGSINEGPQRGSFSKLQTFTFLIWKYLFAILAITQL
jgi:hypothetical protein